MQFWKKSLIVLLVIAPAIGEKKDSCKEQLWWVQQEMAQLETVHRQWSANGTDGPVQDRAETMLRGSMLDHVAKYLVCEGLR